MTNVRRPELGVVNLHYTFECNNDCVFCHSKFYASKDKYLLPVSQWRKVITLLKHYCKRINFAGGEPLLHKPLLNSLLCHCRSEGLIATVVTNGSHLNEKWLLSNGQYLKAIGVSCDSASEDVQKKLGRGKGDHVANTVKVFDLIRRFNMMGHNILPKINTVVTKLNYQEDMSEFVAQLSVKRWKIFQLLDILDENRERTSNLVISKKEFEQFVSINRKVLDLSPSLEFVPEDSDLLIDTYVMVDYLGRFFSNRHKKYLCSHPILDVGIEEALKQIAFNQSNIAHVDRMFL